MLSDVQDKHTNNQGISASYFSAPRDPVKIALFLPFCQKENLGLEVIAFPKIPVQLKRGRIGFELTPSDVRLNALSIMLQVDVPNVTKLLRWYLSLDLKDKLFMKIFSMTKTKPNYNPYAL